MERSSSYTNRVTKDRFQGTRAPMWWRVFGYLAAMLPVVAVTVALWRADFEWQEPADWRTALARAETARQNGDLYGARWLYSHAGRVAFWYKDWVGVLASACGMKDLDRAKGSYFTTHPILVQAMVAAESKKSRAGMAVVAQAFASIEEEKAKAMVLSRIQPDWPENLAHADEPPTDCWR